MNKYRNIKTVVDGITFDSKKEAARYGELKLMQRAKLIRNLEIQPQFPLMVGGEYLDPVKVATYKGDFKYEEHTPNGYVKWTEVVEDVKGIKTPVYNLKKKLMKAIHGIEIREV